MKVLTIFLGTLVIALIVACLLAFPTMWLWNWLMPEIFELPKIDVYQALGMNFLSSVLFKTNTSSSKK